MMILRSKRLEPYVEKFVWQGNGAGEPFIVYPDIDHVMGIQAVGRVSLVQGQRIQPLESAGLTGIHRQPKMFQTTAALSSVLVFFRPEALFRWKLCHPREAAEASIALSDLAGGAVRGRLQDLPSMSDPLDFLRAVEELVWRFFRDAEIDPWAKWVAGRVLATQGVVRVEQLAEECVLSRRQFERRFVERIGIPPKAFAQIAKFQHVLRSLPGAVKLTQLAYDAEYYDQSHFIKEFRKKSGATPGHIRQSGTEFEY